MDLPIFLERRAEGAHTAAWLATAEYVHPV